MDLLRFTTAGSVDDGKSTLIGRLLYDSKAIFEDQMEAIERVNRQLRTTTAVITHNAVIASMADRVITLSGGLVSGVRRNEQKLAARELVW